MRDILFRGKRKDKGNWVEGYYLPLHAVKYLSGKDVYAQIFVEPDEQHPKGWAVVLPETVGQYTGAIDKNNRKMFEGDIVEDICGGIGTIVYQKDECAFYVDLGDTYDTVDGKLYTVIGNVYDNPELLEGDNLVEELPWEE